MHKVIYIIRILITNSASPIILYNYYQCMICNIITASKRKRNVVGKLYSTKYIGRQRMKQEGNASGTSRSRHIKCAGNIFSNETIIVSYIVVSDGISG